MLLTPMKLFASIVDLTTEARRTRTRVPRHSAPLAWGQEKLLTRSARREIILRGPYRVRGLFNIEKALPRHPGAFQFSGRTYPPSPIWEG